MPLAPAVQARALLLQPVVRLVACVLRTKSALDVKNPGIVIRRSKTSVTNSGGLLLGSTEADVGK